MPTEQLTPHFTLSEFTDSQTAARMGIDNTPTPEIRANLLRLAQVMEIAREKLGKPILISSGYRSPALNAAVGGSANSAHMQGLACDFTCPGFGTPHEIATKLHGEPDLPYDQIIYEFASWVHLGLSTSEPRRMALTIDNAGTRAFA